MGSEKRSVLRLLQSTLYASMLRRLIVSDTIRWSRDIYVEYVSDIPQYLSPPCPCPGDVIAMPSRSPTLAHRKERKAQVAARHVVCVNVA